MEVQRLEAELGKIRQDLQGVLGCKGKCEQLATLQETVSNRSLVLDLQVNTENSILIIFSFISSPDLSSGVVPGA